MAVSGDPQHGITWPCKSDRSWPIGLCI